MSQSSARTYVLYEREDGTATPHWQYWGQPRVPDCTLEFGVLHPPPLAWLVRARSAREACLLANESITSLSRPDDLGVWWDRNLHEESALDAWRTD
jgi:hypothetical protein